MPQFSQNTSVALTWSPDGVCHGVRVRRDGDRCRVTAVWSGKADRTRSAGELLAAGAKELAAHEASCTMACGTGDGWGMADLEMPPLPADQLRNALAFELQKHTPIGLERLTWGFRAVRKATATAKACYRVVYVRNDIWKGWCDAAVAVAPVDMLIPAPAVLDPLLEGASVVFPTGADDGEAYPPAPLGRGYQRVGIRGEDGAVLPLTELLKMEFADMGPLAELPAEDQAGFAHATILAVYGLTSGVMRDAGTSLPVPENLKPHRRIALMISAGVLLAVAVLAFVLSGVLRFQANYSQITALRRELAAVDKEIAAKRALVKNDRLKKIQELRAELEGEVPNYPPFPLALNDMSVIIDGDRENKPWVSSKMTWSHDTNTVKFSVEEPTSADGQKPFIEQVELLDALNDSPYVLDARANSSTFNKTENKTTREFTVQLGWPSAEVRAEAATRNNARAAARKAREQKAAAARQKAQEDAQAAAEAAARDAAARETADEQRAQQPQQDQNDGGKTPAGADQESAPALTPPMPPGLPPVPAQNR